MDVEGAFWRLLQMSRGDRNLGRDDNRGNWMSIDRFK